MSLITKKLQQLQPGTIIEITLNDEEKTKFQGEISENDFEESLEIINESGELIITYEDVRNVKVLKTSVEEQNEEQNEHQTTSSDVVPQLQKSDESIILSFETENNDLMLETSNHNGIATDNTKSKANKNIKPKKYNLSFISDVYFPHLSDTELDSFFKSEISREEKKIVNKYYQSYKAKIKSRELESCAGIVDKLVDELENSGVVFSKNTWRFVAYLQIRANSKLFVDIFEENRLYDFLAVYYYRVDKDLIKATVFSALAILECITERNKNDLYTILAETCFENENFGIIASMLKADPGLLLDEYFVELAKYIYLINNREYPSNKKGVNIISDLSNMYDLHSIRSLFERYLFEGASENHNTEDSSKTEAVASTIIVASSQEIEHQGEIVYLSWSSEKGKIEANGSVYEFTYADIREKSLLDKVKSLMISDLKAKDSVIAVRIKEKNGRITDIREDFTNKKSKSPVSEQRTYRERETNLQIGRSLMADAGNENRFAEALPYFEKALNEEDDITVSLSEYINCCMALANKTDDVSYLEKAYLCFCQEKNESTLRPGIAGNECFYKLCVKLKKREEALSALNQILADPKLPVETRLNYILAKAGLLTEMAQIKNNEGSDIETVKDGYEKAKIVYMDWEQRYSERVDIKSSPRFKKIYYNNVLLGIARCNANIGDITIAQEILKRIIQFDPTNEVAKNLYRELNSEKKDESALVEYSETETDNDPFDSVTEGEDDGSDDIEENDSLIYEYNDASGWSKLNLTENDILDFVFSLKGSNRIPIALTYLKATSNLNPKFNSIYNQFSYATNNPFEKLNYSLDNVVTQFDFETSDAPQFEKYTKAAAILRGSFYHTTESDYFTGSAYIDDAVTKEIPSFVKAAEIVDDFRSQTGKGMEAYADYRFSSATLASKGTERIVNDAKTLYDLYFTRFFHENVSQKRFKITKAIVFDRSGLMKKLLSCIIDNDKAAIPELKKSLAEQFIRQGAVVSSNNIDPHLVEDFIDDAWEEAGRAKAIHERVSSELMGSLRNNIRIPVKRIVELFCDWINSAYSEEPYEDADNINAYRSCKDLLIQTLTSATKECSEALMLVDGQEAMGISVLLNTANEIIEKLTGVWNDEARKFYFSDFLKTGYVMLDDDYLPEVSSTFCDLPDYNILSRINAHVKDETADIIDYAEHIFTRDERYHNFGKAEKISEYLHSLDRENEWQLPENCEELIKLAQKKMRSCYEEFNIDLCAASSRGQINNSDAFIMSIDDTVQYWYQFCLTSKNYGFFVTFIKNCEQVIHDKALEYGQMLSQQLNKLASDYALDSDTFDKISSYIENQMFTVAEEMMSRISKGDVDSDIDISENTNEVLEQFWGEFDKNFNLTSAGSGTTLVRLVSANMARKDKKGGEALINNWPRNNRGTSVEQIKTLTGLLGWNDSEIEETTAFGNGTIAFKVIQNKRLFNNREYAHPIAAFGTQSCENGFYVFCHFGYADSGRLIDLCRKLDSVAGNKIILIDYTLSASDRRKLARLMKQSSFANTYLFVDRISVLFLANHYVGGGGDVNNRTLLAISMPFSYYQPYSLGSTVPTAPELFSGRREELLSVESPQGANLIYGGRQLGKTAILRKAANEMLDPEAGRYAFVIDIKEKDSQKAALTVSRYLNTEGIFSDEQITDDWDMFAFNLRKNIKDKGIAYLLLMLDEADCFIDDCKNYNYSPFVALKDIQQSMNGKFKFVLAGLHDVVKFKRDVSLGNNSVIPHLSYINVKPFDFSTAKRLLSEPLSYLGFDFGNDDESEALFMQIFSATNYYPGLIQMFCNKLIENMKIGYAGYNEANSPSYKVTNQQISKVLADREFLAEIKRKFEITLRLGEKNYYYIIALLLAMLFLENESADGYTMDNIAEMANDLGINIFDVLPRETLDASLEELCDLNILKTMGSGYAFRTKSFRDLLGTKDSIFEELVKLVDAL